MLLGDLFHAKRRFATRALGVPAAVVFLHVLQQVALQLEGGAADLTLGTHVVRVSRLVFHQCLFVRESFVANFAGKIFEAQVPSNVLSDIVAF